ncbi:class I SAM-dependent methyltransferase [Christiangramia salexigens]|uniref:SAM-dependent methyltransferase n=1 Tax=Christiangramia salexigens TaxID=1913577 RepID=A0A1L3J3X9_9FLAO|nr:class I SAM-dependent methyltransferase [Christiangramia salexigens]APG59814.1 SAM-dependent methyltransferase [Christiangramia salexigens]
MEDLKTHWEKIYDSKEFEETSWYQKKPQASLNIIESLGLSREAEIIDIGGGDSFLVDYLLELGYKNLSVLDISGKAIHRAKNRLGANSSEVNWIVENATELSTSKKFDLWHDRAAFHFLTEKDKVTAYKDRLKEALKPGGYLVLSTFSDQGPERCSGIQVQQYSREDMTALFEDDFEVIRVENLDHKTPWDATQNFTMGIFRKK